MYGLLWVMFFGQKWIDLPAQQSSNNINGYAQK